MQSIERRARDSLYRFTLMHPERYGNLDAYRSKNADFRELLRRVLPDGWTVTETPGVWCEARPPEHRIPDTGFKIHLSTTHDRAREILEATVPILMEERVVFKVLVDEQILDLSNSHTWGRGACGKFVTVYPLDVDQMRRLMERLHEATKSFEGPYILSDKRYKGSKVLFYRYGAFRGFQRINVYGELMPVLRTDDGRLIPDLRLPYFMLPEGVDDPFPDDDEADAETIIHGRYKAVSALGTSSKGGVYKCIDLETHTEVVVKEARPHVNRGRGNPYDAVDCLKNEHRILKLLEGTGAAPRAIEYFQDWEHSFLAMELVRGRQLSAHMASGDFSLILMSDPSAAELRRYCEEFASIAREVIAGLRAIHERGVVIQDISPRNIMLDREQGKVTFIDFEAAYADGGDAATRSPLVRIFTPGFGVEKWSGGRPTVSDDYRALSRVLGEFLYPPTPFFSLAPDHRRQMLSHVAKEKGVPEAFVRLVFGVEEQPEKVDELLAEATRSVNDITAPGPIPPLREDDGLRRIVGEIGGYINDRIRSGSDPLDLPTDYRQFSTNRLSAAYGASGVALFLQRAGVEIPGVFLDALLGEASKIDTKSYAPGLYVGSSGIAWTLLELGMREEAERLMDVAAKSPLLLENADLFYGAAGFGLANLFFLKRLGDERYLKGAVAAFDAIKPKLKSSERGYFYENSGEVYHSLAFGASGIGYFALRLYQATGEEEHLDYAKGLFRFDLASAEEKQGLPLFFRSKRERVYYPYWNIGSAGIGSVALRFYEALKDERYVQIAQAIGRYLAGKYTVFPTNFAGMAGIGGFFVDLHRATGEGSYLEEARRFVDRIMLFAIEKPSGVVFPGEELLRISTDYGTGSAGTGTLLHRIVAGGGVPYFDL
jgi:predicted Ser/Thr protein kinase